MRRLSTWHIAAFGTPIVTLFIVGACSQQPSSTPAVEPVATPTSAPGDAGDEPGNQVAGQTSQDQSTQEEGQTTDTTPTAEPVATPTSAPSDAGDEPGNQVAGQTSQDQSTQEEGETTDTSDSTATATQEDIEAIINGILAVLLNDAMMDLRDLEEEVEAEIALLADDEQALVGAGE